VFFLVFRGCELLRTCFGRTPGGTDINRERKHKLFRDGFRDGFRSWQGLELLLLLEIVH